MHDAQGDGDGAGDCDCDGVGDCDGTVAVGVGVAGQAERVICLSLMYLLYSNTIAVLCERESS